VSVLELSSLSLRYVEVPVTARHSGAVVDPTGDTVSFAFKAVGVDPVPGDLVTGGWETITGPPVVYNARCLVGPGGAATLAKGTYRIWCKVTDSPEIPMDPVGQLLIF
jgi:hypothetical protein